MGVGVPTPRRSAIQLPPARCLFPPANVATGPQAPSRRAAQPRIDLLHPWSFLDIRRVAASVLGAPATDGRSFAVRSRSERRPA